MQNFCLYIFLLVKSFPLYSLIHSFINQSFIDQKFFSSYVTERWTWIKKIDIYWFINGVNFHSLIYQVFVCKFICLSLNYSDVFFYQSIGTPIHSFEIFVYLNIFQFINKTRTLSTHSWIHSLIIFFIFPLIHSFTGIFIYSFIPSSVDSFTSQK